MDVHPTNDEREVNYQLLSLRLDYTWKYFESAARQRSLFLNFFVVVVGILASAYALALEKHLFPTAIGIALYGLIACISFIFFDHRLLLFVKRGLAVLDHLECTSLFPDKYHSTRANSKHQQLGLARVEQDATERSDRGWRSGVWYTQIWFWQRIGLQGVAALGFAVALFYGVTKQLTPISTAREEASLVERIESLEKAVNILETEAARMPMKDVLAATKNVDGATEP